MSPNHPGCSGIYRGRNRRVRVKAGRPGTTLLLSFIWPGLGQWYAGQPRRALLYALPPLVLVGPLIAVIAAAPESFLLNLLVPSFASPVLAFVALHAVWRSASVVDAWRRTRRHPSGRRGTLPLVVLLVGCVVISHGVAGYYLGSYGAAGAKIFQGARPEGPSQIDRDLGGPPDSAPGGDTGGTERPVCATVNPGDRTGYGDDIDDVDYVNDAGQPPATEPALPESATPVGFDPATSPPPFVCKSEGDGVSPAEGPINVLFVGIDSGLGRDHALTDTLMVASFYRERDTMTMISIPRDTGRLPLYTGGYYKPRINTFLVYASRHPDRFPEGPISALMREVGYILGVEIHFYAATNLEGFPAAVDLVGGVDVTLDSTIVVPGGVMEPGRYHLDGQQALKYARSRHGAGNSDWQRARRQQQLIMALATRVLNPAVAVRLPEIVGALAELVRTNAQPSEVPALLDILERATDSSAEHVVLQPNQYARRIPPAEVNGRYMTELDMSAVNDLSRRVFGPYSGF
jgi:LCP family protein required for cell wall assembly